MINNKRYNLTIGDEVQNVYTYEKAVVIKTSNDGQVLAMLKNGDVIDVGTESWLKSNKNYEEIKTVLSALASIQ